MKDCDVCKGTGKVVPDEPPRMSVILDRDGDAWQRRSDTWSMTFHAPYYKNIPWSQLVSEYGFKQVVYTP